MSAISAVLLVAAVLGTAIAYDKYLAVQHDPREPPIAPGSYPILGHVLGLVRGGLEFLPRLSKRCGPIFTILVPSQKMYIVSTPDLVQKIQKLHRVISFAPLSAKFAVKVCGVSKDADAMVKKNVNGDEGHWGLQVDSDDAFHEELRPGADLDIMNRAMIKEVASFIEQQEPPIGGSLTLKLDSWLRKILTLATTNSVYGPKNPYKDPANVDGYWQFEQGTLNLALSPLPNVTARSAVRGRNIVAKAFEQYFTSGGLEGACRLVKRRYELESRHGLSLEDISKFEVGGSNALLVNTVPAAFWTLFLVFADPALLADIRVEIDAVTVINTENGETIRNLDVTSLKERCPILTSTFQEVLRYRAIGTSVRLVLEDTLVDNRWLLKKGSIVQIPSRVLHVDAGQWGEDVQEFKPRRFMKGMRSFNTTSIRSFGGGVTLCPGRHFATNEVLALASMFISRFDLTPKSADGWKEPTSVNTNATSVVMEPDYDVEVEVTRRKCFEDSKWAIGLTASDHFFALVAEDLDGTAAY